MRTLVRLAAAAVLAASSSVVQAPAHAAGCGSVEGVTVVVDFNRTGGSGIETSCVADGGGDSASQLFTAGGHQLTRVQRQPGAVCKVDGLRTGDACVNMPPGHAFWGLFWSDGDGRWVFSQEGVDLLNVPDGGSVAWAFQNGGSSYEYPGTAPATHAEEPGNEPGSPTPGGGGSGGSGDGSPTPGGGGSGGSGDGSSGTAGSSRPGSPAASASPQASPSPEDDPSATPGRRDRQQNAAGGDRDRGEDRTRQQDKRQNEKQDAKRDGKQRDRAGDPTESVSPSAAVAEGAAVSSDPPATEADGLPAWVAPVAIGALFAVAGVAAYLRRRASATG